MKIYHVRGVRHQAVIFAKSPEEAIAQAIERKLVGDWEAPQAIEVPLPRGYRLVYDPMAAAEQPELPLRVTSAEPEKPYTITPSGVKVYHDWRDNIVVDAYAPPVVWKTSSKCSIGTVPGMPPSRYRKSKPCWIW